MSARNPSGVPAVLSSEEPGADFTAFEQVQSKTALAMLLTRLDVPQPST